MIAQILVADDNPDVVSLLNDYLEGRNHRVVTAKDGFELSQKAAEHRPHLIITDVQMPGAYGSTVHQLLQKDSETANIPIIFMSAHPLEKLRGVLPDDPRTRFLQKPIVFPELETLIKELLPMGGYIP